MKVAEVQFVAWDKVYYFDPVDLGLKTGDQVIVKTELGMELGEIVGFKELDVKDLEQPADANENSEDGIIKEAAPDDQTAEEKARNKKAVIKPILRKANLQDLDKMPGLSEKKQALDFCKIQKEKLAMPMKFFDVHFSYDGSRITFAFIADGRIDFRELVKNLTRHFGKTIRLQQVGIRDEAKIMGDVGHCGRTLCCSEHLKELTSITSEMAELQQCSHRGSERISGLCGRLMCCLNHEQSGYEELAKKMPAIDAKVNVDGKRGKIVGHHVLKQSVDVEFNAENGEGSTIVEVDLNRNKKK